jgi:hypothetical protein
LAVAPAYIVSFALLRRAARTSDDFCGDEGDRDGPYRRMRLWRDPI